MIELEPIGTIHTPHLTLEGMPIQPAGAESVGGTVQVFEPYRPGLADLDGFSHIVLIYAFHQASGYDLRVTPFLDSHERGLFATRAPRRPNPIGLSVVRLTRIQDGILHVEDVDMLDGTPLLDIKPYVPDFDAPVKFRTGWLANCGEQVRDLRSDRRFT